MKTQQRFERDIKKVETMVVLTYSYFTQKAQVLVRSMKLSSDKLLQYFNEWPVSNNRYCKTNLITNNGLIDLMKNYL